MSREAVVDKMLNRKSTHSICMRISFYFSLATSDSNLHRTQCNVCVSFIRIALTHMVWQVKLPTTNIRASIGIHFISFFFFLCQSDQGMQKNEWIFRARQPFITIIGDQVTHVTHDAHCAWSIWVYYFFLSVFSFRLRSQFLPLSFFFWQIGKEIQNGANLRCMQQVAVGVCVAFDMVDAVGPILLSYTLFMSEYMV